MRTNIIFFIIIIIQVRTNLITITIVSKSFDDGINRNKFIFNCGNCIEYGETKKYSLLFISVINEI